MTMQTTINQNILRYAVQTAIICPQCKQILDTPQAVLVDLNGKAVVCCGDCFDKGRAKLYSYALSIGKLVDAIDGRELFPPTLTEAKRLLKALGVVLKYDRDFDEYSVNLAGGKEATRCYTSDLLDAIGTGRMMAAAMKGGK